MAKYNCALVLACAAVIAMVSAVTDEERSTIRLAAMPLLASCGSELGITKEQVLAAKESKNIDALNPCFYACFFKKVGTINSEGLYDLDAAKNIHAKYVHSADDIKKLNEVSEQCVSVNEQSVTDGAKGCDRAKLLVQCLRDHKETFTPFSE